MSKHMQVNSTASQHDNILSKKKAMPSDKLNPKTIDPVSFFV